MPSSYTQSLRLILPVTGELTGTWGDAVNAGLTELVEDAIAGTAAVAMANANVTLTTANEAADQARNMFLNLTGANTAQRDVIVPAVSKLYFVHNGTTGGFGVQVKTAAGTGVVVPNGQRMALYCDGTDVLFAFGSSVGRDVLLAADAAAARTTLDVPSRGGGNATGTWGINISGNAATATNADQLDGIDSTGFTRSTGTSELGSGARTTASVPGGFGGGISLRNAGGGANTATSLNATLHNTAVGDLIFNDTGDGGCEVALTYTPPGDPNTDRRVFGALRLRNDGIVTAKGFLPWDIPSGIGSYMLARRAVGSNYGDNVAGSELRDGGFSRASDSVAVINYFGTGLPGTWKSLATTGSGATGSFGLYIRIA